MSIRVTADEKIALVKLGGDLAPMTGEKPGYGIFLERWTRLGLAIAGRTDAARATLLSQLASGSGVEVARLAVTGVDIQDPEQIKRPSAVEHPSSIELRRLEVAQDVVPTLLRQHARLLDAAEKIAGQIQKCPASGNDETARRLADGLIDAVLQLRNSHVDFLSEAYETVRARPPEDVPWRT